MTLGSGPVRLFLTLALGSLISLPATSRAGDLRGRVETPEGAEGFIVSATPVSGGAPRSTVVTTDGTYVLAGLPEGPVVVMVCSPRGEPLAARMVRIPCPSRKLVLAYLI